MQFTKSPSSTKSEGISTTLSGRLSEFKSSPFITLKSHTWKPGFVILMFCCGVSDQKWFHRLPFLTQAWTISTRPPHRTTGRHCLKSPPIWWFSNRRVCHTLRDFWACHQQPLRHNGEPCWLHTKQRHLHRARRALRQNSSWYWTKMIREKGLQIRT